MYKKKLIMLLTSFFFMLPISYANSSSIENSNPKKQTFAVHYLTKKYVPNDSETSVPVDEWHPKKFVFSGLRERNFFSDSLEKRLRENREISPLTGELSYYENNFLDDTDPEIKLISDERDNLAIQDVWESLWDTFKQTDLGLWYQIFSRDVSSFLQTGFLKSIHEKEGKFYLPFHSDKGKLEKEIDIGVSLSGFFYTDKLLKPNYSFMLRFVLGDDKAEIVYDIKKERVEIGFTNDKVNSFLGENAEFKIYVDHNWEEDVETRGGLKISFALPN